MKKGETTNGTNKKNKNFWREESREKFVEEKQREKMKNKKQQQMPPKTIWNAQIVK